jgi:hypothetical protein
VRDRSALLDAFDDQSTGERREPSVTVRHEDLLVSGGGNLHFTREVLIASNRHQRPGRVQLDPPTCAALLAPVEITDEIGRFGLAIIAER